MNDHLSLINSFFNLFVQLRVLTRQAILTLDEVVVVVCHDESPPLLKRAYVDFLRLVRGGLVGWLVWLVWLVDALVD